MHPTPHPAPHCQGMGYSPQKFQQYWNCLARCYFPYIPYYAFSQWFDFTLCAATYSHIPGRSKEEETTAYIKQGLTH